MCGIIGYVGKQQAAPQSGRFPGTKVSLGPPHERLVGAGENEPAWLPGIVLRVTAGEHNSQLIATVT